MRNKKVTESVRQKIPSVPNLLITMRAKDKYRDNDYTDTVVWRREGDCGFCFVDYKLAEMHLVPRCVLVLGYDPTHFLPDALAIDSETNLRLYGVSLDDDLLWVHRDPNAEVLWDSAAQAMEPDVVAEATANAAEADWTLQRLRGFIRSFSNRAYPPRS